MMSKQHNKQEEIFSKMRLVDVLTSQGLMVGEAVRSIGVPVCILYSKQVALLLKAPRYRSHVRYPNQLPRGTLRLGKQPCLKLTFNWTTFWGQITVELMQYYKFITNYGLGEITQSFEKD